jgi:hypothetical protein
MIIRETRRVDARPMWTVSVPGRGAHRVLVDHRSAIAFVTDGWGVHPSAVRLRAIDLATGEQLGGFRSGTPIRTLQPIPGTDEILAASDTRLHRLAVPSLVERQRWTARIPRYADSMAVIGDRVVLANWYKAGVAVLDLVDGTVRRRPTAPMVLVLPRGDVPLLVGGQTGGVWQVDVDTMVLGKVLDAPPAVDAAWAPDTQRLWLIEGVRATIDQRAPGITTVDAGPGGRLVSGYDLASVGHRTEFEAPRAVKGVAVHRDRLWLHDDAGVFVVEPVRGTATGITLPRGLRVLATAPWKSAVLAIEDPHDDASRLTCFEVASST